MFVSKGTNQKIDDIFKLVATNIILPFEDKTGTSPNNITDFRHSCMAGIFIWDTSCFHCDSMSNYDSLFNESQRKHDVLHKWYK